MRWAGVPCVLVLVAVRTPESRAATDESERLARAHFDKAERAYRTSNYDVAVVEYQAAYEAKPLPMLLYDLAQSYRGRFEVTGNVADLRRAIDVFEAYLRDEPRSPHRETVDRILGKLRVRLSEIASSQVTPPSPATAPPSPATPTPSPAVPSPSPPPPEDPRSTGRLVVRANVPGAEVALDERLLGWAPIAVDVAAGAHRIRVTHAGYLGWAGDVDVRPVGTTEQEVVLVAELPAKAARPPIYRRWWLWSAIGGAVVVGAAAGGLGWWLTAPSQPPAAIDLSR